MNRCLILALASVVTCASMSGDVHARNLFNRQVEAPPAIEALPMPPAVGQQNYYAPAQSMPYQSVQKMPYQASQKGVYQKASVATCVRYVQHHPRRKTCCDCGPSFQTVISVVDPKTCCPIDVPVCLPACCQGYPQSDGRAGIFGRGITNFCWGCGYRVRVVVGHRGDVTVHYYGA